MKIEVFTDGDAAGDGLVAKVRQLACPKCEVLVRLRDGTGSPEDLEAQNAIRLYGLESVPAVVMDGKPVDPGKLK